MKASCDVSDTSKHKPRQAIRQLHRRRKLPRQTRRKKLHEKTIDLTQ